MNIVKDYPPNINEIKKKFELRENVVFTYGDILYNPSGAEIPPELERHEETHARQQGNNPRAWWDKYLVDSKFRLQQEVEAYRSQYLALKNITKDRNFIFKYAVELAKDLSSSLYGNIVGFNKAYESITAK